MTNLNLQKYFFDDGHIKYLEKTYKKGIYLSCETVSINKYWGHMPYPNYNTKFNKTELSEKYYEKKEYVFIKELSLELERKLKLEKLGVATP